MDDELGGHKREAQDFTWIDYMYKTSDGKIGHSGLKAEEAYEKFRIRLISWEAAEPIQNTFRDNLLTIFYKAILNYLFP